MNTFIAVDDERLASRILAAKRQVVYVSPAVSKRVAESIAYQINVREPVSLTILLDSNEDAYRMGFGDPEGLEILRFLAEKQSITLRSQPGLRIGFLVTDDEVLIWSPTARAVENPRDREEPNGMILGAQVAAHLLSLA